jgi:hypothetical protein
MGTDHQQPGGTVRLFLRLKATIRRHPSWDDAEVARAAGAHPAFDAGLIRTARGDVAADAAIPDDTVVEHSFGEDRPL